MKIGSLLTGLVNTIPIAAIKDFALNVRAFALNQFAPPTGPISMEGHKLTNVGAPTAAGDAVNKQTLTDSQNTLIGYADAAEADAKSYTDSSVSAALANAHQYATDRGYDALQGAKAHADALNTSMTQYAGDRGYEALQNAKAYTDAREAVLNTKFAGTAKVWTGSFVPDGVKKVFPIAHNSGRGAVLFVRDKDANTVLLDAPWDFVDPANISNVTFDTAPPASDTVYYVTAIS